MDPCKDTDFATSPRTIIYAKHIIHGPASQPPTCRGIVVLQNGLIEYVGTQDDDEAKGYHETNEASTNTKVYHVHAVMPGLWDVHSHFFGAISQNTPLYETQWKWIFEDRAIKVGRDVPRCKKILDSGFTSCREVGGLGKHLKQLIQEGSIHGPRIYHANTPIHITGGHCDMPHDVPLTCFGSLCSIADVDKNGGIFTSGVDGPIECCKRVRENIREGASVIKICCSGGVLSNNDGLPTQQQFSSDEIKSMTDEARRHDRIVCAHCHSNKGILTAYHA